jgi:Ig-like domain-containing protein
MKSRYIVLLLLSGLLISSCNVGATPAPTQDINAINTAIVGTTVAQLSLQLTATALISPTETPAPTETIAGLPTLAALPTQDLSGAPSPTVDVAALPTFSFVNTPVSGNANTPVVGLTPLATTVPNLNSGGQPSTKNGCNDALYIADSPKDGTVVEAGKEFKHSWELKNTGTCTWDNGYVFAFLPDVSSPQIHGYDITIKVGDVFTKPNNSNSFIVKLIAPTTAGEYKGYWRMKDDAGNFFGSRVYLDIVVK